MPVYGFADIAFSGSRVASKKADMFRVRYYVYVVCARLSARYDG